MIYYCKAHLRKVIYSFIYLFIKLAILDVNCEPRFNLRWIEVDFWDLWALSEILRRFQRIPDEKFMNCYVSYMSLKLSLCRGVTIFGGMIYIQYVPCSFMQLCIGSQNSFEVIMIKKLHYWYIFIFVKFIIHWLYQRSIAHYPRHLLFSYFFDLMLVCYFSEIGVYIWILSRT